MSTLNINDEIAQLDSAEITNRLVDLEEYAEEIRPEGDCSEDEYLAFTSAVYARATELGLSDVQIDDLVDHRNGGNIRIL